MEWLLTQAQTASPLFAVGCLVGMGVLWRRHNKDSDTILALSESNSKIAAACAVAMEKASNTTAAAIQELRALAAEANRRRR